MSKAITRRLVFYCPGYDDDADTRYRRLLVVGLAQIKRRFGIERHIGPVEHDDAVPAQRWTVVTSTPDWRTETVYEILRWDDLVKRDFRRSWRDRIPLLLNAMRVALYDGVIPKLFRIDWHFACLVIYPWVALLALLVAAPLIGYVAARLIGLAVPLSSASRAVVVLAAAAAVIGGMQGALRWAYVYHLLDDWIFNWQHGSGRRPDFDARLDRFGRRVAEAVRETAAEEVLIVGHSTGSIVAVEVAAQALALDPDLGRRGPAIAVLTVGACLPVIGVTRRARRLRQAIVTLATATTLLWVEYQAPQDPLNAFRFDPVRDLGLDLGGRARTNPQIRSPRFKETLSPRTYRKMRWNFFRLHFQFLMPVEVPGEYDYLMIACGPIALADRIADPAAAVLQTYRAPPYAGARRTAAGETRSDATG